jgi:hypothetical protein
MSFSLTNIIKKVNGVILNIIHFFIMDTRVVKGGILKFVPSQYIRLSGTALKSLLEPINRLTDNLTAKL